MLLFEHDFDGTPCNICEDAIFKNIDLEWYKLEIIILQKFLKSVFWIVIPCQYLTLRCTYLLFAEKELLAGNA